MLEGVGLPLSAELSRTAKYGRNRESDSSTTRVYREEQRDRIPGSAFCLPAPAFSGTPPVFSIPQSTFRLGTEGGGGNAPRENGCVGGSGICCLETGAPVCAVALDPG